MRRQCEYVQMSNFGTEFQSLSRKSEEVESVEGGKDPVGCFHVVRKERDATVSATSENMPLSEKPKKRKKKKP